MELTNMENRITPKQAVKEYLANNNTFLEEMVSAFSKGGVAWHKKEWEEFIDLIRKEERGRVVRVVDECL